MIESFEPIFDSNSRVLILGSMASVKSLQEGFYYMHPRNRFWSVMEIVTGESVPADVEGKRAFLLSHKIALMDSIKRCNRKGSLDSDIRDIEPSNIAEVLKGGNIKALFCNGATSYKVASKAFPDLKFIKLPSTSPANAGAWDIRPWLEIRDYLKD